MKKVKIIGSLIALVVASGLIISFALVQETESVSQVVSKEAQSVNLFVTHGHCSTPFTGKVNNLKIIKTIHENQGNPLENMKISFDMNPKSFTVCAGDDLTERVQTPGLFFEEEGDLISFRTTDVYTMGIDWYQVNGKLMIKGVEKSVKFFASGIRAPQDAMPTWLVLEGQFNLLEWGIDYDNIVNGQSDPVPTKWMHLNMRIDMTAL